MRKILYLLSAIAIITLVGCGSTKTNTQANTPVNNSLSASTSTPSTTTSTSENNSNKPTISSTSKQIGKKIQASQSSFTSPMPITIGDEITGSITETCKDNCYSFTITSDTQFNLFVRKPNSITVSFYLVKTSDLSMIAKYGTMSSEFRQYIIPQTRSQSRYKKSSNIYEDAKIYTLLPGSYSFCVGEHASFNYPLAYTFVTFLGDLSENPWTGEYNLASDSATGLGYRKSSTTNSSESPDIGNQWEKERQDKEERERNIDLERHMHPNLTNH